MRKGIFILLTLSLISIYSSQIFANKGKNRSKPLTINTFEVITSVDNSNNVIPKKFLLHQNFPNPFNPDTKY